MEMPKAYDGASLVKALEKRGINGGIDTLIGAVEDVQDFLSTSAKMSTEGLVGKFDDMVEPAERILTGKIVELLHALKEKLVSAESVKTEE